MTTSTETTTTTTTTSMSTSMSTTASVAGESPTRGNLDDLEYRRFRERVAGRFRVITRIDGCAAEPLLTTDVDLWPIYLDAFPAEVRQHHDCSACRHFLRRFGGLVVIGKIGNPISALWDPADADPAHVAAVRAMAAAVRRARVTGVFLSSRLDLGTEVTGAWTHLAVRLPEDSPSLFRSARLTAGQKMAECRQDHAAVLRALAEFPLDLLERVVGLLRSDALYRAERVLPPVEWLRGLAARVRIGDRANLVWRAVATAPVGFCRPRSSVAGTLIDDLAGGMSLDEASRRFRDKMHPLQYQRPQAAPSAGQVAAAERLVEQLGIAASLPRRYARLDEIETVWRPSTVQPIESRGVFGHLAPPVGGGRTSPLDVAEQRVTWERFARVALPVAVTIEALAPERGNYCALTTAADPAAPPILQWDRPERRNPVSWYMYHTGSTATQWGLVAGTWVSVTALALKPSMWGDRPIALHGRSAIAVLAGARDSRWQASGGALFPGTLRSDLHGASATIEAYSRRATLAGYEQSSACGLVVGEDTPQGDCLRVTTRDGMRFMYRIDRWD